jgi:dihydroorotase/N-acyl-D-amino-acid deacylase
MNPETLALVNGTVVDGTGAPGFRATVVIAEGRIARVGGEAPPAGAIQVDCAGMMVAPGFFDVHSHSDLQVLEGRPEKLRQGVTSEVVGNCGFSAFPAGPDRRELHEFADGIFCPSRDWGWTSACDYFAEVQRSATPTHVLSLVGHGSLRIAQAGPVQGPLAERDLEAMEGRLAECLEEGAAGFSTGLMYAPGSSAPFSELERLCRVVARHGKVYATHMRSYFGDILASIDEQLELARRTGCRMEISHLLIAGRKNWGLQAQVIEKIESARNEGIDVGFDCYPYVAGSTVLTQILPQRALDGGAGALVARIADASERARIADEAVDKMAWAWEDIYISAVRSAKNAAMVGKNLAALAAEADRPPIDVVLDLLAEERAMVNMISFNQSEENLRQTLLHPLSVIISDGFYVKGRPHPRLHGTFPKFLGKYARELRLIRFEDAIRKMTAAPAERFGLRGRGRIAEGFQADITVFDPQTIDSRASYENPEAPPEGIRMVMAGGRIVH